MKLKYDYGIMTGICAERVCEKNARSHMLTINVDYYGNFICRIRSATLNEIRKCLSEDFKYLNGNVYELECHDVCIPTGQTYVEVDVSRMLKNTIITKTQWKHCNISNGRLEFHCEPEIFWVKLYQGKRLIRKYEMVGTSNIKNLKFIA